jgi:ComF family protein
MSEQSVSALRTANAPKRTSPAPDPGWRTGRRALVELLDFLLPTRCLGCDDRLPLDGTPEPVCGPCLARLREPPWPRCPRCHFPAGTGRVSAACLACRDWSPALRWGRSAVILEDAAEKLVYALKYQGWRELAPVLARRMTTVPLPPEVDERNVVVVPVPTTRRRQRQRGYNQAALIARAYAARKGFEVVDALGRAAGGGSQVSLRPSQRRSNVREVFRSTSSSTGVAGRSVLLVDDVLTTGATACEAALALERAGAIGVSVITFARALPDRRRVRTP